jgi:HlyD family secretion protein
MNEQLAIKSIQRPISAPHIAASPHPRSWVAGHVRWLVVPAVVLLAVLAGAVWWSLNGVATVHYTTVAATRGPVVRTVTATGTVNPELTIIVGSYVSGVIQSLSCDYNTKVKAGQVCARIDPRPYQSLVDQAKANLDVAKAQLGKDKALLTYTKINAERRHWLVARDSETKDVADLAQSAYEQAQALIVLDQATIEQHQAALDSATINLGYADIVSPVDGTVVSRNVTQGQTVAASFQTPTLFLIATDLTKMQVDTNVSESDIGGIKEGNKATFTVDAYPARVFEGKVTQLRQSPQTVQNVVTYDAVISVANLDLALKPGLTASTRIVVDHREDVLRVPNQALRYVAAGDPSGPAKKPHVWILRDGDPVSLVVVPGLDDDNFTEIASGDLKAGDQVIVAATSTKGSTSVVAAPRL